MAITYEDAVAKLHEWTDSPALRNQARRTALALVTGIPEDKILVPGVITSTVHQGARSRPLSYAIDPNGTGWFVQDRAARTVQAFRRLGAKPADPERRTQPLPLRRLAC